MIGRYTGCPNTWPSTTNTASTTTKAPSIHQTTAGSSERACPKATPTWRKRAKRCVPLESVDVLLLRAMGGVPRGSGGRDERADGGRSVAEGAYRGGRRSVGEQAARL